MRETRTTAAGKRGVIDLSDPRAVRTRAKLVAAFHEAVAVADPSEMSVSALARAAGVNRTSFYAHFQSPEDLAIHALSELFDVISNADIVLRAGHQVSAAQASRRALSDIVSYVAPRRSSFVRLLGPGAAPRLLEAITVAYTERATLALERNESRPAHVDPALTAQFLAGGVLGVIGRWLATPEPTLSPDELVDALVQCLPAWINADPPQH